MSQINNPGSNCRPILNKNWGEIGESWMSYTLQYRDEQNYTNTIGVPAGLCAPLRCSSI